MRLYRYTDSEYQAKALAEGVAQDLSSCLQTKEYATLCIPGGRSPKRFFQLLNEQALDWSKIRIVLNDERWVDASDDRSNQKMISEVLLSGPAKAAQFVSLLHFEVPINDALSAIDQRVSDILPLDVCLLGMGDDGHTASLFAEADLINQALDPEIQKTVLAMQIEKLPEARITLTLPVLLSATHTYLIINGTAKHDILQRATRDKYYPISYILLNEHNEQRDIRVYYAT